MIFVLSVLVAAALYFGLYLIAPDIVLMRRPVVDAAQDRQFRVQLVPVSEMRRTAPRTTAPQLASRPGSMEEMLQSEPLPAALPDTPQPPSAPADDLGARLTQEALPKANDLTEPESRVVRADARIIEIAAADARSTVTINRRLVRPGPDSLLPEGAEPAIRAPISDAPAGLDLDVGGSSLLASAPALSLPDSAPAPLSTPSEPMLPSLSVETMNANRPVMDALEEAKRESAYTFLDDLLEFGLDTYQPDPAQPGYFRLTIRPREDTTLAPLPKQVTFLVDASRSIPQHKLKAGCKGVVGALDTLRPEDRFNVVLFRDSATMFQPGHVAADAAMRDAAVEFLGKAEASGETDVYQTLLPLVQASLPASGPSILYLISDGRPTTGIQDGRTLINGLTADNAGRHTVYAFAGGNNVNRPMLDLLAYRNRGASRVVDSIGGIEDGFAQFARELQSPILVGCDSRFSGVDLATVFPKQLPDFFQGRAVTLYGRYGGEVTGFAVQLSGEAPDGSKEVIFRASIAEAAAADESVAKSWAFEKAYYLIGEISRVGETPELLAALRELSAQYGIRTSYDE